VERILAELTEALRPLREAMLDSLDVLTTLDSLYARASFARDFRCAPSVLAEAGAGFAIRGGRHPLLVARGGDVVPFELIMETGEHTLLLSGPNTGGKTVLLKAIGLVSALVQCGIPAPVAAESRVPIYDSFFADIGDEQSIEASLSTFSAHVRNLAQILDGATSDSLVLIDELGSGTDPTEGAALASAILEELTHRGTFTVATTHLGALKLLATELPGLVNASLQFDEEALAPTYRLIKGVPGRSYGLAIARRLHLPSSVLARAAERFTSGERDVAELLSRLQRLEVELREREEETTRIAERADERLRDVEKRERDLRAAERSAETRARQDARQYLLEARAEVERAIREIRESAALDESARAEVERVIREIREGAVVDESAREARRRVEELAAGQATELERLEAESRRARSTKGADPTPRTALSEDGDVAVDDTVELSTLGGRSGRVLELRGDDAVVAVGAMKLTVPVRSLSRARGAARTPTDSVTVRGDLPEEELRSEIDLRGLRVDEMEAELLHALDGAVRGDLRTMRIIHGKGTGALRERVAELLRGDPRVREFRLGAWNEGGAGVTVAELR
jgi:DNA mismatch repair protein MutS2